VTISTQETKVEEAANKDRERNNTEKIYRDAK
jgi:hypothetical protein